MNAPRRFLLTFLLGLSCPVSAAGGSLITAVLDEDWKTATRLVEKGAELEVTATYGRTPLMHALSFKAPMEFIVLLVSKGASLAARDSSGATPLHTAACANNLAAARLFLEKGADAKARDNYGRTALTVCVSSLTPELHDVLLEAAGAPAAFDEKGQPFVLATAGAKHPVFKRYFTEDTSPDLAAEDGTTMLMTAAYRSTDTVRFLLEKGARKDLRDSTGYTAAFNAAMGGSMEIFRLVFDEKDDVNRATLYDTSLLMRAAWGGNADIVRFVLSKGGNPSALGRYSGSPLYYAASAGCLECAKLLRAEGAPLLEPGRQTALHMAASKGSEEVVKYLLDEGAPVGLRDGNGATPAHAAAAAGKTAVLKLLKSRGADLAAKDNSGATPAVEAASNGRREALEYLLSKTNASKDRGAYGSILYYAVNSPRRDIFEAVVDEGADVESEKNALLLKAAEAGHVETVEYLLSKKADSNYADNDGKTPLMAAAYSGSLPTYKRLLAAPGVDSGRTDKKGRGLVHYAARSPRGADVLKQALNTGGDARARDAEGWTPLHLAAENGGEDSVRLLLERGADANAPVRGGSYAGRTPAHSAVSRYGLPQAFELMKARAVKPARADDASTFAHLAAYAGKPEFLRWALDAGVAVDDLNRSSETALMKASTGKVARLLLERGADPKREFTGYYKKRTPLHFAAYYGRLPVLKALMERGAPLDAVSLDSHTALSLAAADGKEAVVMYLLSKGADPKADRRAGGLACEALKGKSLSVIRLAFDAVKPDFAGEAGATLLECGKDAPLDAVRELLDGGARQSPAAAGALLRAWAGARPLADLRLLVDRGYDARAADTNGHNALMAAASAGRVDSMKYLLERGLPLDGAASNGWAPLACAAASGSREAVDLLLEKGATTATIPRRVPPIAAAVERRRPDMIRYLASKKADPNALDADGAHPFFRLFTNYAGDDAAATVEALFDAGVNGDARNKEGSSPLHFAAKNGSLGMIKTFITRRVKPDLANNLGNTPLAWAFMNNKVEAAKLLLAAGAKVAAMEASNGSALSQALDNSDISAARLLIEHGYPVDKRGGEYWRTPLISVARSYYDSLESLQLLLDKGASLEATDKEGRTALLNAVSEGREAKARFLLERGADPKHKDNEQRTALHLAAWGYRESTATVNALLDKGALPNEKDKDGYTPLHRAVGKPGVLAILVRRGWSLNTDREGRTALHLAVTSYSESTASMKVLLDASSGIVDYTDSKSRTPLMLAASEGDRRLPQIELLLQRKASVSSRDSEESMTPLLHLAYGYSNASSTGAAKLLLDAGADIEARDKNGSNSLSWAIYREKHALAELLLARGADFDSAVLWTNPVLHHLAGQEKRANLEWALSKGANIDAADKQGRTAMHVAAAAGRLDAVKYLIGKGASPNALDAAGKTPLKLAEAANQGAVVVFLRDRTSATGSAPAATASDAPAAPRAPAAQSGVSAGDLQNLVKAAVQGAMEANKPAPGAPKKTLSSDVDKPNYKAAQRPHDLALVIGIERYSGELPAAEHAERDAEAVKAHFTAMGVPPRNLIHLAGSKAGRASIEKYVEQWLPRMAKPDSRVYVYFSGHGAPDIKSGSSYLVPWDGDPNFLETTAYPVSRLYAKLDKLPVAEVLVAMDACFSGAKGRSVLPKGARPLVSKVVQAVPGGSRVVALSASDSTEITGTYDEQGHGLFTYYLLKGLNGAASSGGGVTVNSLYQYLKPKVQDEAGRSNREQTPQLVPAAPGARGEIKLR